MLTIGTLAEPSPFFYRDLSGVHRRDTKLPAALLRRVVFRRLVAVEQNEPTGLQATEDLWRDQRGIEHDQVIRFVNLVRVVDWLVIDPKESLNRRPRTFGGIHAECLHRLAFPVLRSGQQLGQRDPALSASSVNPDFDHLASSHQRSYQEAHATAPACPEAVRPALRPERIGSMQCGISGHPACYLFATSCIMTLIIPLNFFSSHPNIHCRRDAPSLMR